MKPFLQRSSHWMCSVKVVFLKISQESACIGVSFNKVARQKAYNFIKRRLDHRCFPVKFAKFLKLVSAIFYQIFISHQMIVLQNPHTGIPGLWMQELDAGLWTLDSGRRTLDAGSWTLDTVVDCCRTESEPSY